VVARDPPEALATRLDQARRAAYLDALVVAVAGVAHTVDLAQRAAAQTQQDDGGADVAGLGHARVDVGHRLTKGIAAKSWPRESAGNVLLSRWRGM